MVKVRNVSPVGDLDSVLLGRVVAAGEVVEVSKEQAEALLDQPANWAAVTEPKGK
jgi:hypothetical protein